ncbi:MAG: group II intron reverse transcriptase/maturase [Clostridia bacterium]|nr:group II intron reverse transcriptase/maturase [Clostridia bacterium]
METKLSRIAEVAKQKPKESFTSLFHLLNYEMLYQCHRELESGKASGIDGVTKNQYTQNLSENLTNLVNRLKTMNYKPQPALRIYIPKGNGKEMRPLGIATYEDKIVQMGLTKVIETIYEQDYLSFSYGFRPKRNCHDALKMLNKTIMEGKINYIVDADIKGFFNNVSHEWTMKFLELRIKDPNIKRLIVRFMKAGMEEKGIFEPTDTGVAQGSCLSPLLANVYLHYVLDLWFEKVIKKNCRGQAVIIRYCDDFVCGFQYKEEAEQFYKALKERLKKFDLEIAEEKTKIIEFGRFAECDRKKRGEDKPEVFDFLGFTHYCSKSKQGKFRVKRKTSRKKFTAKIKAMKEWVKSVRNEHTIHQIFKRTKAVLNGHFRYYGITDNYPMLQQFKYEVIKVLFKWLNRRSQRRSFNSEDFKKYLKLNPLPCPRIYVNIMS